MMAFLWQGTVKYFKYIAQNKHEQCLTMFMVLEFAERCDSFYCISRCGVKTVELFEIHLLRSFIWKNTNNIFHTISYKETLCQKRDQQLKLCLCVSCWLPSWQMWSPVKVSGADDI